ncbi:MAG TPA: hypothetical protein PLO24_00475 [Bacteroidales bacterium]|jgi:hypothetical protein|nr:hypothetical protein [Bacteroidales bacterium]HOS70821.1 hypothetical protein [Bacteroidales bacterium]HQH24438.1 hypothetical protein [Bacteroidales bacterium]HQJ81429.1 hypothetical protein [Bacteroidales bacterium]
MDKTININLGGILFHIDEEAYRILRDYLLALSNKMRNTPGWNETVEDIELRIAEIFLSKKSAASVIDSSDVDEMILIMGKPEDFTESSRAGNAFNEMFRALGNIFWLVIRAVIVLAGLSFIVAGFFAAAAFIMVFVFRFPGIYAPGAAGINISYLPEFLNYVINPKMVPWISFLTVITVILPLLALVYLGIKMVFRLRAADGIFFLAGFVIWILGVTILSILLFNEGISFVETARSGYREYLTGPPETLYIKQASGIAALDTDNEISIPGKNYFVFIDEVNKQLYIGAHLDIMPADGKSAWIDVTKRSSGKSKTDAAKKADRIQYNYRISGDTLFLDEYFTYPEAVKWSFDVVDVHVNVPRGTKISIDSGIRRMLGGNIGKDFVNDYSESTMIMTRKGLEDLDSEQKTNP